MPQEINTITDIGDIPNFETFQSVKNTPSSGKTNEPQPDTPSNKYLEVANTVKGLFSEHSEKLFSLIALIGFILVFYNGKIENWNSFFRFSAFLIIVIIFYFLISIPKYITKFIKK